MPQENGERREDNLEVENDSAALIQTIEVSTPLAKANEKITVTLTGEPGGRARFSIARIVEALDIEMREDPDKPGSYSGSYTVQVGDNVEDTIVTVIFTSSQGETVCETLAQSITIDTIPPTLRAVQIKTSHQCHDKEVLLRNGDVVRIEVETKPNAVVKVDVSQLDTTRDYIFLKELTRSPGVYQGRLTIRKGNKAPNGIKFLQLSVEDALGNQGENLFKAVTLQNSELPKILVLTSDQIKVLESANIYTLAHLRAMNIEEIARKTNLNPEQLELSRSSANLQAIGSPPEVAEALISYGNLRTAAEVGLASTEEIAGVLRTAIESGSLQPIPNILEVIHQIRENGKASFEGMLVAHAQAELQVANQCKVTCPPENSVFSYFAYLQYLIETAGFKTSKELIQQFGWDLSNSSNQPIRRRQICIQILQPLVQIDRDDSAQQEYDFALYEQLVGLTEKTETELKSDPIYKDAFSHNSIWGKNESLLNILSHSEELSNRVEKIMSSLEPLYLEALISQSKQSSEELRNRFCISFESQDYQEITSCQQAILCMQEYLTRVSYETASKQDIFLHYDEWNHQKVKQYYPENFYTYQFKKTLINGERNTLKNHLIQARQIIDSVRLSDGKEPSPEEEDALLKSFRNRNPYYQNIKKGIELISDCLKVDDLITQGHEAFYAEEYRLSKLRYLQAAELIRKIYLTLSNCLKLPLYRREEIELVSASYEASKDSKIKSTLSKDSVWIGNNSLPDYIEEMTAQQIKDVQEDFLKNLIGAYSPLNIPGSDLGRGQLPLRGVGAGGTFLPLYETFKGTGWSPQAMTNHLSREGWDTIYLSQLWVTGGGGVGATPPAPTWTVTEGGQLYIWSNVTAFGCLLYQGEPFLKDISIEIEFIWQERSECGVVFNAKAENGVLHADCVGINGRGNVRQAFIGYFEGTKNLIYISPTRAITLSNGVLIRINIQVIGGSVRAKYQCYENGAWQFLAEIPLTESLSAITLPSTVPDSGKIGFYCYHNGQPVIFRKLKVLDLSAAMGPFSDRAFFLEPGYSEALVLSVPNPKPKHLLIGGSNSAYVARKTLLQDSKQPLKLIDDLSSLVSFEYNSSNYIVTENIVRSEFDAFYHQLVSSSVVGLWYGQGDQRLVRENLGKLLDLLPNLFFHQYFFILPICLGDVANSVGQYQEALSWYLMVYDEQEKDPIKKLVYRYLNLDIEGKMLTQRIARNYLDWGEYLFQADTQESIQRARIQYKRVLDLLDSNNCCNISWTKSFKFLIAQLQKSDRWLASVTEEVLEDKEFEKRIQNYKKELTNWGVLFQQMLGTLTIEIDSLFPSIDDLATLFNNESELNSKRQQIESHLKDKQESFLLSNDHDTLRSKPKVNQEEIVCLENKFHYVLDKLEEERRQRNGIPFNFYFQNLCPSINYVLDYLNYYCIPANPYVQAFVQRACRGIYLIDHCFNTLGFPNESTSIYRFEYLLALAKNFANLALASEKDFLSFKEKFEADTLEAMDAAHAVSLTESSVRLVKLQLQEASSQIAASLQQVAGINAQIKLVERRIEELGSKWSVVGIIFGAIGTALSGGVIAGGYSLIAGISTYMGSLEEAEEGLRKELEKLRTSDLPAARLNVTYSIDHYRSVEQQAYIAKLEAEFKTERATFLTNQFFNPQLWGFLAQEIKKYYRTYIEYGTIAAWMAQRALEFERGLEPRRRFASTDVGESKAGLNIVRFDYFQPSIQGMLGADNLLRDIATLEQEKLLNDQRKLKITKVISLAQAHPLAFAQFLQTGQLSFATSLMDFDFDYPGHYQRRIKEVRVNLFGLIGPEGIKATLTHLGPSLVTVKEWDDKAAKEVYVEKTLSHPIAILAMTNPQPGGLGKVALAPEEPMLKPFEGKGVAGNWIFEMLKMSNEVNFNTIADVQLIIEYTALHDEHYRTEVIQRLPRIRTAIRPYSFCAEFSDACFHLKDATRPCGMIATNDGTTGAHTLVFQTRESDFAPNQLHRRLKEVVVYLRAKDGIDANKRDLSNLRLYLSCQQRLATEHLVEADLTLQPPLPQARANALMLEAAIDHQAYDPAPHYLGKWQADDLNIRGTTGVVDTWYLHIPPDAPAPFSNAALVKKNEKGEDVLVNGHKVLDFSILQDVIFALHYEYHLDFPATEPTVRRVR